MKAFLITTGSLFALMAVVHIWRAIDEWPHQERLVSSTRLHTGMDSSLQMLEPIRLEHCLQGWPPPGPNAFRWQSGRLTYRLPDRSHHHQDWDKVMTPAPAQWAEFWRVCDEIEVWSWPRTLGNLHLIDGLQWITELAVGSRCVASSGQVHGSPPDFVAKVMRLHQALQAIAGWRTPAADD